MDDLISYWQILAQIEVKQDITFVGKCENTMELWNPKNRTNTNQNY